MAKKKSSAKMRMKQGAKLPRAAKKAAKKAPKGKQRSSKKVAAKKSAAKKVAAKKTAAKKTVAKKKAVKKKAVKKKASAKRAAAKPSKKTKSGGKKAPLRLQPAAQPDAVESFAAPAADLRTLLTPEVAAIMGETVVDDAKTAGDDATWLEED